MSITMQQLAELAGVTRSAVSAVLNNSGGSRVSPEKRLRILELARKTGYVPNLAARQLKGIPDRLIGVITVPSHMGIMATLQAEVISALQRADYEALTTQQTDVKHILRDFQARNVSGILALGQIALPEEELFCPYASCSHFTGSVYDVSCDLAAGSCEATVHLIEKHGRRNPVFLSIGDSPGRPDELKFSGMVRALRDKGMPAGENNLLRLPFSHRQDISPYYVADKIDAEAAVEQLIRRKADAVLTGNDFVAARLLPWLQSAGIRIPEDMALIGYDGYSWTPFASVPLATVVQPVRAMAETAVGLLLKRIENPAMEMPGPSAGICPVFLPAASCGCACGPQKLIDGIAETLLTAP